MLNFVNMKNESQYLTDKSVLKRVVLFAMILAFGVVCCTMFSRNDNARLWGGLAFVSVGLIGIVKTVASCCWYPVLKDEYIVLEHYLLPGCRRTLSYREISYARVGEFNTRRFGQDLVLTVRLKKGKTLNFMLMTRLNQLGQLKDDLLSRGVPDAFDPQTILYGEKKYFSVGALSVYLLLSAFLIAIFCWACVEAGFPLMIVLIILLIPFIIFQMNLLSYIVVDGRSMVLKYLIFKSKDVEINLDDADDVNIGPGGHLSVRLKSPDKNGKDRYTRLVGLVSIEMIQEIDAYLKFHKTHMS